MDYTEYTEPETWSGGYYELSIEIPFDEKGAGLNQALYALKNLDIFNGFWERPQDYQSESLALPLILEKDCVIGLYGLVMLSDGNTLPCLISIIRSEGQSNWLDISIPQSAMAQVYPYEYPPTAEHNPWLLYVNNMFIEIAESVYRHSPFLLALVGEEISGHTNHKELTPAVMEHLTCILPPKMQSRIGVEDKGKRLSKQLRLYE